MRHPRRRPTAGAALLALLIVSGCGPESAPPLPPPAAAEEQRPEYPVAPEPPTRPEAPPPDARYSGADQPPAGLADDLPLYAGAAPVSSMSSPSRGTIVDLRSNDAPAAIFAWYRDELPKRGWLLERESETGGHHLVTAIKEGRRATLLIKPGADGTRILLTVAQGG
jgi:hypothetical protein